MCRYGFDVFIVDKAGLELLQEEETVLVVVILREEQVSVVFFYCTYKIKSLAFTTQSKT